MYHFVQTEIEQSLIQFASFLLLHRWHDVVLSNPEVQHHVTCDARGCCDRPSKTRAFRRFLQKTLIPYSYFTAICPVNESRPNIGLYSATNDVMSVVICLRCLFGPCFWFRL